MKVIVELIYDDGKPSRRVEVEIRDGKKGLNLLNAVSKAVNKQETDNWVRWNLLSVKD